MKKLALLGIFCSTIISLQADIGSLRKRLPSWKKDTKAADYVYFCHQPNGFNTTTYASLITLRKEYPHNYEYEFKCSKSGGFTKNKYGYYHAGKSVNGNNITYFGSTQEISPSSGISRKKFEDLQKQYHSIKENYAALLDFYTPSLASEPFKKLDIRFNEIIHGEVDGKPFTFPKHTSSDKVCEGIYSLIDQATLYKCLKHQQRMNELKRGAAVFTHLHPTKDAWLY